MAKTFFTADTHFGHAGIIEHCQRPFLNVASMDEALIQLWNDTVGIRDTVWHLGDFAWRKHEEYLARLHGRIHLIRGNHDKMSAKAESQFESVRDMLIGRPTSTCPKMFLIHYPLVTWPRKHPADKPGDVGPATIHLYGHVHGGYDRPGEPALDVGIDNHAYQPLELKEVLDLVAAKMKNAKSFPKIVSGD